jgi:hypothetical protein
MAAMREEAEWITPVDITVGDLSEEEVSLLATWQIKDFTEGSPVTFYWKAPQDQAFREIAAQRLGGGRFQAEMKEPATVRPDVIVSYGSAGGGKQDKAPARPSPEQAMMYTYFVTMETGGMVKSADARNTDLSKLSAAFTYGLSLSLASDSRKITASVREAPSSQAKPAFRLEGANLEGYSGTSKVLDINLPKARTMTESVGSDSIVTPVFEGELPKPSAALSALWLNLTYSGGRTARVELAPSILQ